jgi:hypothetical protein
MDQQVSYFLNSFISGFFDFVKIWFFDFFLNPYYFWFFTICFDFLNSYYFWNFDFLNSYGFWNNFRKYLEKFHNFRKYLENSQ